jgi:NADPH:quinone reductase-like Zn-dependent oxidoreductase
MIGLTGAYAQYVSVKASSVAPKPKTMSIVEAAPGGVLIQISPGSPATAEKAKAAQVTAMPVRVHPDGGQLREIASLIDARKVKTSIAATFPLAETGRAHELSKEGHTRGKIVLTSG